MNREPVPATPRGAVTPARKRRIWEAHHGCCAEPGCQKPLPVTGPEVVYDHILPIFLGGTDTDENLQPLCADPCNKTKTAWDAARCAKLRRQQDMAAEREPSRLQGRPFPTDLTRDFHGRVRPRNPGASHAR